jgi:hypothetical protein
MYLLVCYMTPDVLYKCLDAATNTVPYTATAVGLSRLYPWLEFARGTPWQPMTRRVLKPIY